MGELVKYSIDGLDNFQVLMEDETVWLTQAQMSELFQKDRTVITKHIANIFKEKELEEKSNVQILHIANSDKPVKCYNLNVIISIGYRVKSQRGTQFRIWATKVLKEYLLKGYAVHRPVNKKELDEVKEELMRQINNLDVEVDAKMGEIYEFLITWLSKKKENESKPRPRIGF
ncbi:MAG: virulence RhuM family protein [Prevotellaceae bacterium]|jgi:hypothetical protein|nr:virulence RhuM family protein [Prevotellaceae bacterium]